VIWLVFGAAFASVLGVSFSRAGRSMRDGRQARLQLGDAEDEWQRRTLDVVISGEGEVAVAVELQHHRGTATGFRMVTTGGAEIEVEPGAWVEITVPTKRRGQQLMLNAGQRYSVFVSSHMASDGPLRASTRVPASAKLIIHQRGWNPVKQVDRLFQRRWRRSRVLGFVFAPSTIVALIAWSTWWVWLGILALAVLVFDAVFLQSAFVALNTTRTGPRELP
jgi:hypothetical protein